MLRAHLDAARVLEVREGRLDDVRQVAAHLVRVRGRVRVRVRVSPNPNSNPNPNLNPNLNPNPKPDR